MRPEAELWAFVDGRRLRVVGRSAWPWLRPGDILHIDPDRQPEIGDLVVVRREDRSLIVHRCVALDAERLRTRGDNQKGYDPWFWRSQLCGVVIGAERRDRSLPLPPGALAIAFAPTFRRLDELLALPLRWRARREREQWRAAGHSLAGYGAALALRAAGRMVGGVPRVVFVAEGGPRPASSSVPVEVAPMATVAPALRRAGLGFSGRPGTLVAVAWDAGAAVGAAARTPVAGGGQLLHDLKVASGYRRRGIARTLYAALLAEPGLDAPVVAGVAMKNLASRRMHRAAGLRPVALDVEFGGPGGPSRSLGLDEGGPEALAVWRRSRPGGGG